MDGLLLDTERVHLDCFVASCVQFDLVPDMHALHACVGTNQKRTREILTAAYGPDFPWNQIRTAWQQRFHTVVETQGIDVKQGAQQLLEKLVALKIPAIVVTATSRDVAESRLHGAGIRNYFVDIVGGDDVNTGKPHPEPYLEGLKRLNAKAERCWALEDSENGVRSAHAAGLTVFQVPDLVEPGSLVLQLGHTVCQSLDDIFVRLSTF
ncbi:MAG: HAD family phosphatase [Pseudomonadales bacterium]|nr:HAD family phosphatase [Pseudomonadales bacterium]